MSGVSKPTLRVTIRCLEEDLSLSRVGPKPIETVDPAHSVIVAFTVQRSQNPVGQEIITGLTSRIVAWSLHSGRFRAATWHDEEDGVVWLLAAAMHRSGEAADAYPFFRALDSRGRLLPVREDFVDLEGLRSRSFAEALIEETPALASHARSVPGTVYRALLGGRVRVRLLFLPGEMPTLTVAISQRLEPGEMALPENWLMAVIAAFFPHTPPAQVEPQWCIGDYPLSADEVAYWEIDGDP